MTSICEKKISAEVRLIHAEQISLYNYRFKKTTIDAAEDCATEARDFKLMGIYGFFKTAVTKYGSLHVYKLTTYLVSQARILKIPLFKVYKNCLGKQFTYKFLRTPSTNQSLKNVLCSKSILIIVE